MSEMPVTSAPEGGGGVHPYILFIVAGTTYAVRSHDVLHMEMIDQVTPVPNAPLAEPGRSVHRLTVSSSRVRTLIVQERSIALGSPGPRRPGTGRGRGPARRRAARRR